MRLILELFISAIIISLPLAMFPALFSTPAKTPLIRHSESYAFNVLSKLSTTEFMDLLERCICSNDKETLRSVLDNYIPPHVAYKFVVYRYGDPPPCLVCTGYGDVLIEVEKGLSGPGAASAAVVVTLPSGAMVRIVLVTAP